MIHITTSDKIWTYFYYMDMLDRLEDGVVIKVRDVPRNNVLPVHRPFQSSTARLPGQQPPLNRSTSIDLHQPKTDFQMAQEREADRFQVLQSSDCTYSLVAFLYKCGMTPPSIGSNNLFRRPATFFNKRGKEEDA